MPIHPQTALCSAYRTSRTRHVQAGAPTRSTYLECGLECRQLEQHAAQTPDIVGAGKVRPVLRSVSCKVRNPVAAEGYAP